MKIWKYKRSTLRSSFSSSTSDYFSKVTNNQTEGHRSQLFNFYPMRGGWGGFGRGRMWLWLAISDSGQSCQGLMETHGLFFWPTPTTFTLTQIDLPCFFLSQLLLNITHNCQQFIIVIHTPPIFASFNNYSSNQVHFCFWIQTLDATEPWQLKEAPGGEY